MAEFDVNRSGLILAVADFQKSLEFYRDRLGFEVNALFDDPPYAILSRAGTRLSLAEQGHPAPENEALVMIAPSQKPNLQTVVILEVDDCEAVHEALKSEAVEFFAPLYSPPWGGHRCFAVDPDGYLIEIEQLA
jgi:catechol 2,3-dioxygenase-like lactoylglutathione lyase family enzyme